MNDVVDLANTAGLLLTAAGNPFVLISTLVLAIAVAGLLLKYTRRSPSARQPKALGTSDYSTAAFIKEKRHIFHTSWTFVGHGVSLPNRGDYMAVEVLSESVLVVRQEDGDLKAFHNVCRHRGARLISSESEDGTALGNASCFRCPYHAWTYGLDGSLKKVTYAGDTGLNQSNCRSSLGLLPVHLEELHGMIFIALSDRAPPFEPFRAQLSEDLCLLDLPNAKIVKTITQEINANWKLIVENNFECYHCVFAHPQYAKVHYADRNSMRPEIMAAYQKEGLESGALCHDLRSAETGDDWGHKHPDTGVAWFRSVRFPFRNGIQSESLNKSGRAVSIAQGTLKGNARAAVAFGSAQMMTAYNFYSHSSCDYTMTMKLEPLSATQTRITRTFLVHPDAIEGEHYTLLGDTNSDADCDALDYVWDVTYRQDVDLILAVAKGISSEGYIPGPLNPNAEPNVAQWHKWFRAKMKAAPAPPLPSLEW